MTIILTTFNFESPSCWSIIMKNFKRTEKVKFKGTHLKLYIDKNDSVYDVKNCVVVSWKKKGVPEKIQETRDVFFFNLVKGNPTEIATNRILARLAL